jgi:hypothetical protein
LIVDFVGEKRREKDEAGWFFMAGRIASWSALLIRHKSP